MEFQIKSNEAVWGFALIVELEGMELPQPFECRFTGVSRNDSMFSMEDEPSGEIFEYITTYAAGNSFLHETVMKDIKTVLEFHGNEVSEENIVVILKYIKLGYAKAESMYGNGVRDFEIHGADAILIFK